MVEIHPPKYNGFCSFRLAAASDYHFWHLSLWTLNQAEAKIHGKYIYNNSRYTLECSSIVNTVNFQPSFGRSHNSPLTATETVCFLGPSAQFFLNQLTPDDKKKLPVVVFANMRNIELMKYGILKD